MGKPKERLNPTVTQRENKRLKLEVLKRTFKEVSRTPPSWEEKPVGRKGHDKIVVTTLCCYKEALVLTYEELEDEINGNPRIKEILGVDKLPGSSVAHRGMQKLDQQYIRKINRRMTKKFKDGLVIIIVDASGFRLKTSSTWYDIRIKRKSKRKDHKKLHIVCDYATGVIFDFVLTLGRRHDSPPFKRLLKTFKEILLAIGDSAYLSRKNCDIVARRKGTPFFRVKKNSTPTAARSAAWKKMVNMSRSEKELFNKIYRMRSFVEAIFSSIKRKYGNSLTAIKAKNKNTQLSLKVFAYNVRRILYVEAAEEMGLPLWVDCENGRIVKS